MNAVIKVLGLSWLVSIMLLLLAIDGTATTDSHTRLFCAYGKIFVEFSDENGTWGTMMLDDNGAPIPCHKEDRIDAKSNLI